MWVSGAMKKFDKEGNLVDDGVMKQLTKYIERFCGFCDTHESLIRYRRTRHHGAIENQMNLELFLGKLRQPVYLTLYGKLYHGFCRYHRLFIRHNGFYVEFNKWNL
jgi:hypothetical protein